MSLPLDSKIVHEPGEIKARGLWIFIADLKT